MKTLLNRILADIEYYNSHAKDLNYFENTSIKYLAINLSDTIPNLTMLDTINFFDF